MNNLKFRHYDTRLNEMRYSDKHDGEFYVNTKGVMYMYAIPKSESGLETEYYKSYDVDMFTGLKDINGIDIYQGDIVAMPFINPMGGIQLELQDFTSEVFFERGSFLVYCNDLKPEKHTIENWIERCEGEYKSNYGTVKIWWSCVLTVVGNIHENK